MKQILLFLFFVAFAFSVSAQDTVTTSPVLTSQYQDSIKQDAVKSSRLIVNVGLGIPFGPFGDEFIHSGDIGFRWAETGNIASLSYMYDVHRNFGVGASAGFRINKVNAEGYLNKFNSEVPQQRIEEYSSESWKTTFLLADFYVQIPLKKLTFYSKASYGLTYTSYSLQYLKYSEDWKMDNLEHKWDADPVIAVSYGLAGGLRYDLGKIGVGIEAGFMTSRPEFEIQYSQPDSSKLKEQGTMNVYNCTIQLFYRLN